MSKAKLFSNITKFVVFVLAWGWLFPIFAQDSAMPAISSLKLNSVSVQNLSGASRLTFGVNAKKALRFEGVLDVEKAALRSLGYFFTGLALSDDKFWVNLNPYNPEEVMDRDLAGTDLGQVMLNADLRLKERFCELSSPQDSDTGREFWSRLYAKARAIGLSGRITFDSRLWIIPEETEARESEDAFSIIRTRFKVNLESGFTPQEKGESRKDDKGLQDYARQLMEELILPVLNKEVNDGPAFAELREAYSALVLCRWYRERFPGMRPDILAGINTDPAYDMGQVYEIYLKSFSQRELSPGESAKGGNPLRPVIRRYSSGGVDFRAKTAVKNNASLSGTPPEEGEILLICGLDIPAGRIDRPWEYAKANFTLFGAAVPDRLQVGGNNVGRRDRLIVLATILPSPGPISAKRQVIEDISRITDRILLASN